MEPGGNLTHELVPREYRLAGLAFYCVVFAVGSTVNLTALWVFVMSTKRRNSITVYMINVAVADLLFLALLPFRVVYYALDRWPFGDALCRTSAALTVFYPCAALWLFALIGADRYAAIVRPPRRGKALGGVRKAAVACVGVWAMALGVAAPLLFVAEEDDPDRGHPSSSSSFATCAKTRDVVHLRRDNPVNFVRLACFFLVPVCIMVGCYAVVVESLLRGRASRLKPEVKRKSVRIVVALTAQVLVCFVPFHVCLVVLLLQEQDGAYSPYSAWVAASAFLMSLSTVLDVVLYYVVSKQFQDRVVSVILYRKYLRSVRRKSARSGSVHSLSNLPSGAI